MKSFILDPYLISLYIVAAIVMGGFVSVYNYLSFRLENKPFSLSHIFISFIFLMYIFGVFGTLLSGKLSNQINPRKILIGSVILMIIGMFFLISDTLYFTIFGLGIITVSFFGAHTMASRMVALYAKTGKSSATSIYWLFYYFGSTFLGSGTGYVLQAFSWSKFIVFLILFLFIALALAVKKSN